MRRIWDFVTTYSILMMVGAVIALIWANINPDSYHALVDATILDRSWIGHAHHAADGSIKYRTLTFHYLVNDVLMAFFFAIAGKEVWEAIILNDGSLKGRSGLVPLLAAAGGMAGPVLVYLGLAALLGTATWDGLAHGWAVPTATDIAFSYIVARIIFGPAHPAVGFLLLLAIVDDAAGLVILAIFYPTGALAPQWLLLSVAAAGTVYLFFNWLPRRLDHTDATQPRATWVRNHLSFWPYAVAGALSWYGFQQSGLHPALGLLPVIPAIPHADRGFGIFAEAERRLPDLLNRMEHGLKVPVEIVLFLFGLLNAGVAFGAVGTPTWLVLTGLLVGKPVGIALLGWIGARGLGLGLPVGMSMRDVGVVGFVAAIGFTVALFVASVAFSPDATLAGTPVQDAAKLGALLSVLAGPLAWLVARWIGVQRRPV